MMISFIIPHKGREDLLTSTIDSIAQQSYPLQQMEVIIVTQNKHIDIAAIQCNSALNVIIEYRPESDTISALRNTGAQKAKGDYFAFLDADIQLSPNWVDSMLHELNADQSRALVSAVQRYEEPATILEKIRTRLSNANIDCKVRFLPGRNLLLKKETFTTVGGFPEHLVTCEDYYFTNQVYGVGTLYYSSKANYIHLGEDKKLKEMFHKEIWRGQSNIQSIRGRPIPASEIPSFLVPVWILIFTLCTLISLLSFNMELTFLSGCLTLLPVALYSYRLYKISENEIPFIEIVQFYLTYFPARIIGTLTGLFKIIHV